MTVTVGICALPSTETVYLSSIPFRKVGGEKLIVKVMLWVCVAVSKLSKSAVSAVTGPGASKESEMRY